MVLAAAVFGETRAAVSRTVERALAAPLDAFGMGYTLLAAHAVGVGRGLPTDVLKLYMPERLAAESAARFERARQWLRTAAAGMGSDAYSTGQAIFGAPTAAAVRRGVWCTQRPDGGWRLPVMGARLLERGTDVRQRSASA
jgi:hypothetical protein